MTVTVRLPKIVIGANAFDDVATILTAREPVVAPLGTVTVPVRSPEPFVLKIDVAAGSQPVPSD